MRVWIPTTLTDLATAHAAGEVPPGEGRLTAPEDEEQEYAALLEAADASAALLAARGEPGGRRTVVVAVRDAHRSGWQRAWVVDLLARSPSAVLVALGMPDDAALAPAGGSWATPRHVTASSAARVSALAAAEADRGRPDAEVRVDAWLSFNGHAPERFIDPTVDLAAERRDLGDDDWILPR